MRSIAPKPGYGVLDSCTDTLERSDASSTGDEGSSTSAELLIKLPNGEMLPLSKLPVTKENTFRGYSIRNPNNDMIRLTDTTPRAGDGSIEISNTEIDNDENPRQKLKDLIASKSDSSSKLVDTKKTVNPYISIVQVMYLNLMTSEYVSNSYTIKCSTIEDWSNAFDFRWIIVNKKKRRLKDQ